MDSFAINSEGCAAGLSPLEWDVISSRAKGNVWHMGESHGTGYIFLLEMYRKPLFIVIFST